MWFAGADGFALGSVSTALGDVWIAATDRGLCVVTVPGQRRDECLAVAARCRRAADRGAASRILAQARDELAAYFRREQRSFAVPLDPHGTAFQRQVWATVRLIPYGETASYGEVARLIGRPRASRAVGAANGANPLAIIVPCHRLIGGDGRLVKYGGGLARKRWLLEFERGGR